MNARSPSQGHNARGAAAFAIAAYLFFALSPLGLAVELSCLKCHNELEQSLGVEGPSTQWQKSVHKQAGITCDGCHGGDPAQADAMEAMSPERGFIGAPAPEEAPDFCGRCHVAVREHFIQSTHWTTELPVKPNCVTCHTAHEQQKVSLELVNEEFCGQCHSYEPAQRIKMAIVTTDKRLGDIAARTAKMKYLGYDSRRIEESHFALRSLYHTLFHELSIPKVEEVALDIAHDLSKIEETLEGFEVEEQNRRSFGYFLMVLFVLAAVATREYRKSLPE